MIDLKQSGGVMVAVYLFEAEGLQGFVFETSKLAWAIRLSRNPHLAHVKERSHG
jgi:hypothetical protein